jgi:type II secretory pathway component GspD/PulD (secretin)
MARRAAIGLTACLAVVLGAGLFSAWGQNPGNDAPKDLKRTLVVVRNAAAKDVAAALTAYFKNEPDVSVTAEANSNCLLINAPGTALDEVLKTIDQLDRKPQLVTVEVVIADLKSDGKDDKEPDEKEFTGPAADVLAKVEALKRKGQLTGLKRVEVATVEGQKGSVRIMESRPFITGTTVRATGVASNTISYRDLGSIVTATPRLSGEKTVGVELTVEDARVNVPEDGVPLGSGEKGNPINAAEFVTAKYEGKLTVPLGQAVLAKGVKTTAKGGAASTQTLVIVTARLADGK